MGKNKNINVALDPVVNKIFAAKRQRRKELANLSIEEKIRILIKLQEIASPINTEKKEAWHQPWQIKLTD